MGSQLQSLLKQMSKTQEQTNVIDYNAIEQNQQEIIQGLEMINQQKQKIEELNQNNYLILLNERQQNLISLQNLLQCNQRKVSNEIQGLEVKQKHILSRIKNIQQKLNNEIQELQSNVAGSKEKAEEVCQEVGKGRKAYWNLSRQIDNFKIMEQEQRDILQKLQNIEEQYGIQYLQEFKFSTFYVFSTLTYIKIDSDSYKNFLHFMYFLH